jgi:hypothetical protein
MLALDIFRKRPDGVRVGDVKLGGLHAGMGSDGGLKLLFPSARDNDLVSLRVKCLGKPSTYSRTSAGDQDGISTHLHNVVSSQ